MNDGCGEMWRGAQGRIVPFSNTGRRGRIQFRMNLLKTGSFGTSRETGKPSERRKGVARNGQRKKKIREKEAQSAVKQRKKSLLG